MAQNINFFEPFDEKEYDDSFYTVNIDDIKDTPENKKRLIEWQSVQETNQELADYLGAHFDSYLALGINEEGGAPMYHAHNIQGISHAADLKDVLARLMFEDKHVRYLIFQAVKSYNEILKFVTEHDGGYDTLSDLDFRPSKFRRTLIDKVASFVEIPSGKIDASNERKFMQAYVESILSEINGNADAEDDYFLNFRTRAWVEDGVCHVTVQRNHPDAAMWRAGIEKQNFKYMCEKLGIEPNLVSTSPL